MGPMLCTVKVGEKEISCGGVIDLAVEQPQLFRKLHKNKTQNIVLLAFIFISHGHITPTNLAEVMV